MAEFVPTFTARRFKDHAVVSYQCVCGCTPMAHVYQDSAEAGHEHCCCGRVHFAGVEAMPQMEAYLARRRVEGLDDSLTYTFGDAEVQAPWGGTLAIAYALPHAEDHGEHEHDHDHHEHAH